MSDEIAKAVETGVKDVAEHAGGRFGSLVKEFYEETGQRMIKSAENVAEAEAKNKTAIEGILKDGERSVTQDARTAEQDAARAAGGEGGGAPLGETGPGQSSEGNAGAPTCGDPVDVVSGQLVTWARDLNLPGLLPLVVRRAYASGYRGGALFGPGWSCTLDQRVEIGDDGIRYAGDDAQILLYPIPTRTGERVLPVDGARWPLTWDRTTDSILIEDPGTGWTRHFPPGVNAAARPITAMTDRNGHRITYARDQDGLPTAIGHSGGYRVAVETTYTSGGFRVEALRLLSGSDYGGSNALMSYRYDPRGHLTGVVNSSDLPFVYEYDNADRMTAWIDRNGYRYEYEYDDEGRVVHAAGADGTLAATFTYDPAARITRSVNSLGEAAEFHYDTNNHLVKTVDPAGNAVLTEHDRYGRLLSYTDPLGHTLRHTYDRDGNRVLSEHPDGSRVVAEFNERGQAVRVTGPDGGVYVHAYDDVGNLLSVTDPLGAQISYSYDEAGRITTVTDPLGFARTIECDAAGLPVSTTDAQGGTLRYRRDALGRVAEATDALGGVTRFAWNVEGNIVAKSAPDGARDEYVYDPEGNLVEHRDAAGNVSRMEYDGLNLLIARIDPDGARYGFGYDSELRLTQVTNLLGAVWSFEYDATGYLAAETDFEGRTLTYIRDAAGQLIARTTPSGRTVEFEYDSRGNLTRQRVGDAVEEYAYNAAGWLVSATNADCQLPLERDQRGRVLRESVNGRVMTHSYDLAGQRTERITPSGVVTQWTYDPVGMPASLASSAGSLAFQHDLAGRETARHLSDSVSITRGWDPAHRLTGTAVWRRLADAQAQAQAQAQGEYELIQSHGYAYRADGVPTTVANHLGGDRQLSLDQAGRVTAIDAVGRAERYAYDAAGNITSRIRDVHYEYDEDGRLVAATRRTLSGQRRVWRYTWNGFDRLVGVETPDGASWRYRYDALGRRIAKQRLGADGQVRAEVLFVWDDTRLAEQVERVEAEYVDWRAVTWDYLPGTDDVATQTVTSARAQRAVTTAGTAKTVASAGAGQAVMGAEAEQAEIDRRFYAIVTDLVGTPQELLTLGGDVAWRARHDLWGAPLATDAGVGDAADCPLRFPGQYHDPETGLHYNFARYYDPATGRYITPDPLGLEPSPNNRAYVPNPLTEIDPLGLAKCLQLTDESWDHIFKGGVNDHGGAYGYHHRPGGVDRYGVRTTKLSDVDKDGVYRGTVTQRVWDGNRWTEKSAPSTFFPDDWSQEQVKHAVTRAVSEGSIVPSTNRWIGKYRGIDIAGYFHPETNVVITAYPLKK